MILGWASGQGSPGSFHLLLPQIAGNSGMRNSQNKQFQVGFIKKQNKTKTGIFFFLTNATFQGQKREGEGRKKSRNWGRSGEQKRSEGGKGTDTSNSSRFGIGLGMAARGSLRITESWNAWGWKEILKPTQFCTFHCPRSLQTSGIGRFQPFPLLQGGFPQLHPGVPGAWGGFNWIWGGEMEKSSSFLLEQP